MRPIHLAQLDETRPVLVLTRELVRPHMRTVTVAPITTTARGLSTEVSVGTRNGLHAPGVGQLFGAQEQALSDAIRAAFDLD